MDRGAKMIGRGGHRAGLQTDRPRRQRRPDVKADDRVDIGIFKNAVADHPRRAACRRHLFRGLEDKFQRTGDLLLHFAEHMNGPQQDRRVGVMPAGVHHAGNLRGEGTARVLLDAQRVHVGAERDARPRTIAL